MMSLPVWLPGPMFLLGGLYPGGVYVQWGSLSGGRVLSRWVSVRQEVSFQGSLSGGRVSVQGGLCPAGSLSEGGFCQGIPPYGEEWAVLPHPTGILSCLKMLLILLNRTMA